MDKPVKIVALAQEEINYVAEYAPESPTLAMLANVTALLRSEVRRINAEYVLAGYDKDDADSIANIERWQEGRKL